MSYKTDDTRQIMKDFDLICENMFGIESLNDREITLLHNLLLKFADSKEKEIVFTSYKMKIAFNKLKNKQ